MAIRALATMAAFLVALCGCRAPAASESERPPSSELRIGYGLAVGSRAESGMRQAARNVALEGLINYGRDGRGIPWLAQSWSLSDDGLTFRVALRPSATFHDGSPVTAGVIRENLARGLGGNLGPAYEDIREIRAVSDYELEFLLRQPSAFLGEALDLQIEGPNGVGTGPFKFDREGPDGIGLQANAAYYLGAPEIQRIRFKPYGSIRSAWADLLRGRVDMLYEAGVESLDSLESSNLVTVFTYRRHYAYMAIMNVGQPALRDPALRRKLNQAIDRQALIADGLGGKGAPAVTPVWPDHWANETAAAVFAYDPQPIAPQTARLRLRCLFADTSHERLALALQRQLRSVGVDLILESVALDELTDRLTSGDFDLVLTQVISGPSLSRPYLFWHSKGPLNYSRYRSGAADRGLDTIRHARSDEVYKKGVAAFQRAISDDPPAIFLAWIERARAVSTRFEVPAEPRRDVWSTLRLWHPVSGPNLASRH